MKVIHKDGNGSTTWHCDMCDSDSYEEPTSGMAFDVEHAQNMDGRHYLPEDQVNDYMYEVWTGECGCQTEDADDFVEQDNGEWMCGECENNYDDKNEAVACCSYKFADT